MQGFRVTKNHGGFTPSALTAAETRARLPFAMSLAWGNATAIRVCRTTGALRPPLLMRAVRCTEVASPRWRVSATTGGLRPPLLLHVVRLPGESDFYAAQTHFPRIKSGGRQPAVDCRNALAKVIPPRSQTHVTRDKSGGCQPAVDCRNVLAKAISPRSQPHITRDKSGECQPAVDCRNVLAKAISPHSQPHITRDKSGECQPAVDCRNVLAKAISPRSQPHVTRDKSGECQPAVDCRNVLAGAISQMRQRLSPMRQHDVARALLTTTGDYAAMQARQTDARLPRY